MVLNGMTGARLHIPFPVINRASFGFWLSYFAVISRAILAMFWYGVQVRRAFLCFPLQLNHHPSHTPDVHRIRMRLPDVESYMALNRSCPQPSVPRSKHYNCRRVFCRHSHSAFLTPPTRYHVLPPLLAYPVSLDVSISTKDPAPFHCKVYHRTNCVGGYANLGPCKSTCTREPGTSVIPT